MYNDKRQVREAQIARTISRKSKTILFCTAAAAAASRTYKLFWHTQRYFSSVRIRFALENNFFDHTYELPSACRHRIYIFKENRFGHKSTDLNSIEKWFDTSASENDRRTHGNILHIHFHLIDTFLSILSSAVDDPSLIIINTIVC